VAGLTGSATVASELSGSAFRRFVPINMDSCFRRNDGKGPELIRFFSVPVTLDTDPGSMSKA
jgi:hypothetical protein